MHQRTFHQGQLSAQPRFTGLTPLLFGTCFDRICSIQVRLADGTFFFEVRVVLATKENPCACFDYLLRAITPSRRLTLARTLTRTTVLALASVSLLTAPVHANRADITAGTSKRVDATIYIPGASLTRFAPASDRDDHTIDYTYLDEPLIGTRFIYGHDSRLRLEGNRVAFSFLTEYRQDLERVGSTLDIKRFPRNEQLAFWFNLHNVAVIEALASRYPLTQTVDTKFGPDELPLDDAKLITIGGVPLSPRDIRERIVYANWKDRKVIYGFWRGEIGGPSI